MKRVCSGDCNRMVCAEIAAGDGIQAAKGRTAPFARLPSANSPQPSQQEGAENAGPDKGLACALRQQHFARPRQHEGPVSFPPPALMGASEKKQRKRARIG